MKKYDTTTLYEMVKYRHNSENTKKILNGELEIIEDSAWDYLQSILDRCSYDFERGKYNAKEVTTEEVITELENDDTIWEETENQTPIMWTAIMEEVKDYIWELEEVITECGGLVEGDFYKTAQYAIARGIENEIRDGVEVFTKILKEIQQEEAAEALTA